MSVNTTMPTVKTRLSGDNILNIDIDFLGQLTDEGGSSHKEKLGKASLHVLPDTFLYQTNHSINYQDLVNAQSMLLLQITEVEDLANCLRLGKRRVEGTIAVLEQFAFYPQFRGKGLFKVYLGLVLKELKEKVDADYVFIKPFPIGIDPNDNASLLKEKTRLEKLYSKFGFQKFPTREVMRTQQGDLIINYHYMKLS